MKKREESSNSSLKVALYAGFTFIQVRSLNILSLRQTVRFARWMKKKNYLAFLKGGKQKKKS
jgi:hypothetical protein